MRILAEAAFSQNSLKKTHEETNPESLFTGPPGFFMRISSADMGISYDVKSQMMTKPDASLQACPSFFSSISHTEI